MVVHSDMQRTGWFECSNQLLNRLHDNVVWGMRGNFLYLPTDCPQRDERLGWTGDIQVFAPTASFLYDCHAFLASWLVDLALEQSATGAVPLIVPNVLSWATRPAAGWGDAATVVPSVLYERFGDASVLEAQYDSMRAWADQILALAGPRRLWEGHFQFGDWLDPDAPAEQPGKAKVHHDIVASAYLTGRRSWSRGRRRCWVAWRTPRPTAASRRRSATPGWPRVLHTGRTDGVGRSDRVRAGDHVRDPS